MGRLDQGAVHCSYMSVFRRASSDGMSEITSYMWSGEDASSLEVSALSWCLDRVPEVWQGINITVLTCVFVLVYSMIHLRDNVNFCLL